MKHPHFSASIEGTPTVEAHPPIAGDNVQVVIRDDGFGLGVVLYGTPAQLLAVAEGIRDAVHLVEMYAMSARVDTEAAALAEVE